MSSRPLKYFCSEPPEYGPNIPASEYGDGGLRFLRTTDIHEDGSLAAAESGVFVDRSAVTTRHVLQDGDLLFSRSGTLGRCLRYESRHGPASFAGYLVRFRPLPDVDSRFLQYCAQAAFFQDAIAADAVTSTISNFNAEKYASLRIPWCEPKSQRAIADYLDTETARIDALITKKRHLIKLLEERWITRRREVVLGTLDPVAGVGNIPDASWDQLGLGVLIELQRGHDLPNDERKVGTVPIVSSGGISGYHSVAAARGPGVVTGRYGTIGEVFYVECDYWPLNTTLYVKDFRNNDPEWICHLLAALPLDAEKDKSAVTGINRNVIGQLRVPRPPLHVQQRIAQLLNSEDRAARRAISSIERQLELLAEHRQALITAAVTGDLEIQTIAA